MSASPIGDGKGTPAGCREGCLYAVLVLLVLLVVGAVFAVGLNAVTAPQPTSSTSVRSTP